MPRQFQKLQAFPEMPRDFWKCLISAIPCNIYTCKNMTLNHKTIFIMKRFPLVVTTVLKKNAIFWFINNFTKSLRLMLYNVFKVNNYQSQKNWILSVFSILLNCTLFKGPCLKNTFCVKMGEKQSKQKI